jgi:tRNA threonylcarbamoyladenosine biosynthesis protein TsaE
MISEYVSENPGSTKSLGALFSKILDRSGMVLFSGELGAGKTTFITGVSQGLGIKDTLSSPSFAILNVYKIRGKRRFIHADLYRLDSIDEILNTGIEDYFYGRSNLVFIEWGDKLRDYLKSDYLEVEFNYMDDLKRQVVFKSTSRYWDKKLELLKTVLKKCKYSE